MVNIKLDELVVGLDRATREFQSIATDLYSGDTTAINRLNPSNFSERNKRLFELNAHALKGKTRTGSERHYIVHPASAAYSAGMILSRAHPDFEKVISITLTHDLLDEGADYNQQRFDEQRRFFGTEFNNEVNSAILLAHPDYNSFPRHREFGFDYIVARLAKILQILKYGQEADAHAVIADGFHNQFDLPPPGQTLVQARGRSIANTLFSNFEMRDHEMTGSRFYEDISGICEAILESERGVSKGCVKQCSKLDGIKERYEDDEEFRKWINAGIENHLEKYGFQKQPRIHYPTIMFAGLPGTGKSTCAQKIEDVLGYDVLSILKHRRFLQRREYVEALALEDMTRLMGIFNAVAGCANVLDSTFSGLGTRQFVYDTSKRVDKDVIVIECICSRDESLRRMANRPQEPNVINEPGEPSVYGKIAARFAPISTDLAISGNEHVSYVRFDTQARQFEIIRLNEKSRPMFDRLAYILLH